MPALTIYRGARDATPAARDDLPWPALVDELTALLAEPPAGEKVDVIAFAPHRLRDGTTRAAANVDAVTMLAIDVDGCDLAALDARLGELGAAALVYTSPSDTGEGARRVRVIAPTTREIAPAECPATRLAFAEALGLGPGCGVEGALDASRVYFVGRAKADRGRPLPQTPRESWRYEGAPVDVDALLATPLQRAWGAPAAPATTAPLPPPGAQADAARRAAAGAVLAALGPCEAYDGRKHALVGALGGVLRHGGWTRDDCAAVVRAWLTDATGAPASGVRDVEAGVAWACAAWDKLPEEVSGRAVFDALAGGAVGAVVSEAALLPWRARRDAPADDAPALAVDARGFRIMRTVDWRHPPKLRYVVPGLELAPGKVSVIQGFAYTSKTPFALLLAVCVAAGLPFLGHPVEQHAVAYLDHEGGLLTQERAVRICAGLGVDREALPLELFPPAEQFSADYLDELERFVREHGVGLVVIDTYASAFPAIDGGFNDSAFRVWADALGKLANATGVLVVIVIHETKSAHGQDGLRGISGHGSLAGAVQAAIALERPDENKPREITVRCARATRQGFPSFAVRWDDVPCEGAPDGLALAAVRVDAPAGRGVSLAPANALRADEAAAATRAAGEAIMRSAPRVGQIARADLVALGGRGKRAGERALALLVEAGLLTVLRRDYQMTESGRGADAATIAAALGSVAGFQR